MKGARWLDHLPPWLAWGAIASTGAYGPGELAAMLLPLLGALAAEARPGPRAHWRRPLELLALAALLLHLLLRVDLLVTVVDMLFVLCGVRLCLPRAVAQRRQLLLMGFLIFLSTAVATSELDFLVWTVLWVAGAAAVLLQLGWEPAARLHPGPAPAPPYLRVLGWAGATLALGVGFFVVLPRLPGGLRRLPARVHNLEGLQAGFSDELDLAGRGPIQGGGEVALRIQPAPGLDPGQRTELPRALGLLRGVLLEELDGRRWRVDPATPAPSRVAWGPFPRPRPLQADFFVSPNLLGTIPLPYGAADLVPAGGEYLRQGPGATLRWSYPQRRITAVRVGLAPADLDPEPAPGGLRLARLTATGPDAGFARDWSRRVVPGDPPPRELAEQLTDRLRTDFRYTLANPSGGAADPLRDFLERSHAGHCEYFAAALALMLRDRGVPARIANGYRLGPWVPEGGYYRVTQAEAHSWVEYYDPEAGGWRVADPTPWASAEGQDGAALMGGLTGWLDTLRFHWDRYVVRFSGEDQLAGAAWARDRMANLPRWRPGPEGPALAGLVLVAGALAWGLRHRRPRPVPDHPARATAAPIRELAPLVRRLRRRLPPRPGETAHRWLLRLARLRPDRAAILAGLARDADAAAYGRERPRDLRARAREEARHW